MKDFLTSSQSALQYIPIIRNLGVMNQHLISSCLDYGLVNEAMRFKQIDTELMQLLNQKAATFNFINQVAKGMTLLVGEGNLSFSLSLANINKINPRNLTATTFEDQNDLSDSAVKNSNKLKFLGASIIYGVDATNLAKTFGSRRFDTIVFQFPHAGSRKPVEGHNPNFILVRDFLISARSQLSRDGMVLISAVNNPHYQGAFHFDEVAMEAGFQEPLVYPFSPSSFPVYEHTMTHQDGSATQNHDKFSTWVFML